MDIFTKFLIKHLFFLVSVLFLLACNQSEPEKDYFDENGTGQVLSSQILCLDSARVGIGCDYVIGDKLIVDRQVPSHRYEIFTIKGDSLLYEGKFMNIGKGPNEMSYPALKYDQQTNRMFVYSVDNLEGKLFIIDLNNFKNIYDQSSWDKRKLPIIYTRSQMELVNDSVFLNRSNIGGSNMFSLSYLGDKDNDSKSVDFKYPGEHPGLPSSGQDLLFKGTLKRNPKSLTFTYSCYFSPYLFIFDLINEQITNIRCLSAALPVYQVKDDFHNPFGIADQYKSGFTFVEVTDLYIYIGYNNLTWGQLRDRSDFKGYPDYYFDRINVFDWDGNFVKRLVLDKPVRKFVVHSDDNYLYASSLDLTQGEQPDQVLRFMLKDK